MSKVLKTVNDIVTTAAFLAHTGKTPKAFDVLTRAELQREAAFGVLTEFVSSCYHKREGEWAHIYSDGMIPRGTRLPWASHVKNKSKLRRSQRNILRKFLMVHQTERPLSPFLFLGRCWHLDINRYPTEETALHWCDILTPKRWLQYATEERLGQVSNSAR